MLTIELFPLRRLAQVNMKVDALAVELVQINSDGNTKDESTVLAYNSVKSLRKSLNQKV